MSGFIGQPAATPVALSPHHPSSQLSRNLQVSKSRTLGLIYHGLLIQLLTTLVLFLIPVALESSCTFWHQLPWRHKFSFPVSIQLVKLTGNPQDHWEASDTFAFFMHARVLFNFVSIHFSGVLVSNCYKYNEYLLHVLANAGYNG